MAVLWLWVSPLAVDSRGLQILRPRPLPRTATHSWGLGRGPRWQDFFLSSPSDSKVQPIIELHEIELTRWQLGCGDARQKQDLQTFVTWHWSHTPWEIQIRYVHLYFFFPWQIPPAYMSFNYWKISNSEWCKASTWRVHLGSYAFHSCDWWLLFLSQPAATQASFSRVMIL